MLSRARLVLLMALLWLCGAVSATETDQFTMPNGKVFADLKPYFTRMVYDNLVGARDKLNAHIESSLKHDPTGKHAEFWHEPEEVAETVRREFPQAQLVIEGLERRLYQGGFLERYPGHIVAYKEWKSIYSGRSLLDPGKFFTLHFSSTIRFGDVYMGTDKIGHFFDKGSILADVYYRNRREGKTREEAEAAVVRLGAGGSPIYGEATLLGWWSSGVYSNADLICDYLGHVFYRNVTEPMMVAGQMREPMMVRDGPYWRLNDHVTPESDFFAVYISDHFNEALNPNHYTPMLRSHIRSGMIERGERVLDWYSDENGLWREPSWFDARAHDLSTYFGLDYGHRQQWDKIITIADVCYPQGHDLFIAVREGDASAAARLAGPDVPAWRGRNGETLLHAAVGRADSLRWALGTGIEVDAPDASGRTALHYAARLGDLSSVTMLLEAGAGVDVRDAQGRTPLHDASEFDRADVASELIARGATADAVDRLGQTPTHLAARAGASEAIGALAGAGARLDRLDDLGWTPAHHAASEREAGAMRALIRAGASVDIADFQGVRPAHLAARVGSAAVLRALQAAGADLVSSDQRGMSPLHEAAFAGEAPLVAMLLDAGARFDARSARGETARDIAWRRRNFEAANVLRLEALGVRE
ncbi:MAG: ankyrin repeat domain-containing protein [Phycisphaeraceae bacterium]|nr:ankyrin repeat domain-containing protein [Phycisphaeraceae bacterium]